MAKRKRIFVWFLEPLDADTNAVFARRLPGEDAAEIKCSDGEYHELWLCPVKKVRSFDNSRVSSNLKFNIFRQEGRGQIARLTIPFKNIGRQKKPTIQAADKI